MVVGLLWFVVCFNFMNRILLTTMHGSIVGAFGLTETRFGLLTSIFLWTYGLSSPVAGFLADRFGRRRMIILSLFIWSAITFLTAYARTFEQLLAMRALVGICEACYLPAGLALISEYHRGPTRSFAIGLHLTGMVAGSAIGGFGGWAAEHFGWPATFAVTGIAGVLYCGPLLWLLREAPRSEGEGAGVAAAAKVRFGPALLNLFSHGSYVLAIVYWGVLGATSWGVSGWMPTYLQEHFHLSQGAAGIDSADFGTIGGLAGMLGGGIWADRWSRRNRRGPILVPIVGVIAAAPALLLSAHTAIISLAIVGIVCFATAGGFANSNMMPILCLVTDPRYRATGYGVLNMTGTIAGGLAVFVMGVFRDRQVALEKLLTWGTVNLLICAILLALLKPPPSLEPILGGGEPLPPRPSPAK